MSYDFQTGPRFKKESFRDMVVNDIDVLRIVLIGPAGSGKTSFVGKKLPVFNCMLRETYFSRLQAGSSLSVNVDGTPLTVSCGRLQGNLWGCRFLVKGSRFDQ